MSTQLQALELWRNSLVASVRGDSPDLSARQMALMLCIYLGEGPHTVRGPRQGLKISSPPSAVPSTALASLAISAASVMSLTAATCWFNAPRPGGKFLVDFATLIQRANHRRRDPRNPDAQLRA